MFCFQSIMDFIVLFRDSLQTLGLLIHEYKPVDPNSLLFIDGNLLYNTIIVHMMNLKQFNFSIKTFCLPDAEIHPIVESFQTG